MSAYKFKAILSSNGVIERIVMQAATADATDNGNRTYWDDPLLGTVKSATVVIEDANQAAGSRQAVATALISPASGFAANGIDILPSWFVGCIAEFQGSEGGDAQALKFRQVSLLKNFTRTEDNENPQTLSSYDALKYINVVSGNFSGVAPGDVISQVRTGYTVKAYFDSFDGNANRLYYHQNSDPEVNFLDFGQGNLQIIDSQGGLLAEDTTIVNGSVVQDAEYGHRKADNEFNGKVIFHENRIPFQRAATQTEEVKLIIQL
jgi:hypothetical protein